MEEKLRKAGENIETQIALLESLEGYAKLTERQQNIIRGSFVLQQMIETGTETGPVTRAFMNNMYCHSSISALENKEAETLEAMRAIPPDYYFSQSGYGEAEDFSALQRAVESTGFPCVILFASTDPTRIDVVKESPVHSLMHSCLALGRDKSGNIIVWEKMSLGGRYGLLPLREVHNAYLKLTAPDPNERKLGFLFGVRPLKSA
jgi:hypothetical protein